jgi:hypothetical protein
MVTMIEKMRILGLKSLIILKFTLSNSKLEKIRAQSFMMKLVEMKKRSNGGSWLTQDLQVVMVLLRYMSLTSIESNKDLAEELSCHLIRQNSYGKK